jgi:hypothetical protein
MARMSEEQKKDLKFKLGLAVLALCIAIPVCVIGPYIESVRDHYRDNAATDPNAPTRLYWIATIQMNTGREEAGIKTCELFWELFMSDEEDWDLAEETSLHKYLDEVPLSYMYWKLTEDEDEKKAPVALADKEVVAKVLVLLGNYFEGEHNYERSDHLMGALRAFWPEGTEGRIQGDKGLTRSQGRSF